MVKIVECPRDAWQGLPGHIAPEVKAAYIKMLIDAGFKHIDAVSFVSPTAVPQMADSEEVLRILNAPDAVEIVGIVANIRGAERAIATGAVRTLGFPYSVSSKFLERNQGQGSAESLQTLDAVYKLAFAAGLKFVAYISMAFGNPYGDIWHSGLVAETCNKLIDAGVRTVSLADTVGMGSEDTITETVAEVIDAHRDIEIGVHLHARPASAPVRIEAAYKAGCRRFDSAIGGIGGCPFAQDDLVGNIPTELLLSVLKELGAELPLLRPLDELIAASAEIAEDAAKVAQ